MATMSNLIDHAAEAVTTSIKTADPVERVRAAKDVISDVAGLRNLGLAPDDAINRIVRAATVKLTGFNDGGQSVTPECYMLDEHVRQMLSALSQ